MMTFLEVLKIIGIVLLVLIVLVIALLLAVILVTCFWPFGYELIVTKHDKFDALARVHWLFRIVKVDVWYEDGLQAQAKVFGKKVYDINDDESTEEAEVSDGDVYSEHEKINTEDTVTETDDSVKTEAEAAPEKTETKPEIKQIESKDSDGRSQKRKKRRKKPGFFKKLDDKIDEALDFLIDLPQKSDELIDRITDKADEIIETIEYYSRLMTSSGTEYVWEVTKKRIGAILMQFIPKRLDLKLDYTNDDPCKVVKVWQYYALSLPIIDMIPGKVEVSSEQTDENSYELDTKVSGRFYLGPILWHGGIWYMDKKVRGFIRRAKREGK